MRILIIGKNGQLSRSIQKIISNFRNTNEFYFTDRKTLDLSKMHSIHKFFQSDRFDVIINAAAYTSVDEAEKNPLLANKINNIAVKEIAKIARRQNLKLIHISTDYVFDGKSNNGYKETDKTSPINVYGKTKSAGEHSIKKIMLTNAIIIRTSWVYSEFSKNFLKTMLNLSKINQEVSVVNDQRSSPTYAEDLAFTVLKIITSKFFNEKKFVTETYHYSNVGVISWFDFAKEIFRLSNIQCEVKAIKTENYFRSAKRPKNSSLNTEKIFKLFKIPNYSWNFSLKRCIKIISDKSN